ncbi:MAG: DNA-processing protein DprA, partial [Bacillota bacterium]
MLLYLLWLAQVKGIGPVSIRKLLDKFKNPEAIYRADKDQLLSVEGIGASTASALKTSRSLDKAKKILEFSEQKKINILTCLDKAYPKELLDNNKAPAVLYYLGAAPRKGGVAIIGSRKCSDYGKKVACDTAAFLAGYDIPVISGMATGIDGYAHTSCLKAGGYTLAFLGGGADTCFPKEHYSLKQAIIEKGTVISQFPPGTSPQPAHFPRRNYLMAAWARQIVVVEAAENSGALITAEYGWDLQRPVYAVPGSIYSKLSRGSHALLTRGAELFTNPGQLLHKKNTAKEAFQDWKPPDVFAGTSDS